MASVSSLEPKSFVPKELLMMGWVGGTEQINLADEIESEYFL